MTASRVRSIPIAALCLLAAQCHRAEHPGSWDGKVVAVSDGDTIKVSAGTTTTIRLHGVDAPESGQEHGEGAKAFLTQLVLGKQVHIDESGKDRYGRVVAEVRAGEIDVGDELIRNGWAWQFVRYDSSPRRRALQDEARTRKAGLWVSPTPIPPWEWRGHGAPATDGGPAPLLRGNVKSHRFHRPGCKAYDCKQCTEVFATSEEARRAGYLPCGACQP